MSRELRATLVAELGSEVRANQAAVDAFDEAVAQHLGVNRTALRCIDVLISELPAGVTPGLLGTRLGLTTGSVTALIDRLEKLGYVTRSADPGDRRKVVVRPTETALSRAGAIYGPLAVEGGEMLDRYTPDELRLIADFLRRSREIQEEHLGRLRER